MTGHVNRVEQRELVDRLNDLERVIPIYQQALEHIAGTDPGPSGQVARDAIREAQRGAPE